MCGFDYVKVFAEKFQEVGAVQDPVGGQAAVICKGEYGKQHNWLVRTGMPVAAVYAESREGVDVMVKYLLHEGKSMITGDGKQAWR